MKIKLKIFSTFLFASLLLAISGVSLFYYFSYRQLQTLTTNNLLMAAKNKALWLNAYFQERRNDVGTLASSPNVSQLLQSDAVDVATQGYLLQFKQARDYGDIYLINKAGKIIWTAERRADFGTDLETGPYQDTHLADIYRQVMVSGQLTISDFGSYPPLNRSAIFIAAPVNVSGGSIGLAVVEMNTKQIDGIMQDSIGLGKSGKTYLIGPDYLMRSDTGELRESSILKQRVETQNGASCFGSYSQGVVTAKDYRGLETLGTRLYIPETDWCLLAEIDKSEAFAPLDQVRLLYLLMGLAIFLGSYLVAANLSRRIANPIEHLRSGIKALGQGQLKAKLGTKANDEVGELSRVFDKMVTAIRASRSIIERQVREQTKEIGSQKSKLEKDHEIIVRVLGEVKQERDKAEAQRDKINAILHGIGDGVFFVANNGKITIFNEAARAMSGFGRHEVIGKTYHDVLKFKYEEDAKVYYRFIADTFKAGRTREMAHHVLLQTKNGRYVPVNAIASLLRDDHNKVTGCIVVLRDMTKEERVEKMKTEFVSLASHQLRTPLSAIRWFLEMLLEDEAGKLNDEQRKVIGKISSSNDRMIRLVNGLLNISRIESGDMKVEPKPTDLAHLCKTVAEELQPLLKARNHHFKLSVQGKIPKIKLDPRLIHQVIMDFFSNAIKYTKSGGRIVLTVSRLGQQVKVAVKDNGIGIPSDQHDQLFKKFFRANNVLTSDIKGTGLGLYVTKSIVEASGGKIGFESSEKHGSTFWFTVPLKGSKSVKGEKSLEYYGIHI